MAAIVAGALVATIGLRGRASNGVKAEWPNVTTHTCTGGPVHQVSVNEKWTLQLANELAIAHLDG